MLGPCPGLKLQCLHAKMHIISSDLYRAASQDDEPEVSVNEEVSSRVLRLGATSESF